jgi:hypothetical protein
LRCSSLESCEEALNEMFEKVFSCSHGFSPP